MKDYYAILGVERTADDSAIKSAYRKLAKEFHPDTNKAPGAEARFKEIGEAHDVLKDPQKRAQYDAQTARPQHNPGGGAYSWTNSMGGGFRGPDIDIDELMRDLRRSRQAWPEDAKNRDIVLSYTITLEEAFKGKDAEVSYILADKETQKIQFKVPAGIHDGIKLRFQGKGDDSRQGVPPGDLYVRIQIAPHAHFIRANQHLVTTVVIDYLDAILGTEKEIHTIDGGKIKMKVPAGILPGQSLRAQGKGMSAPDGSRGDMMVEVVFEATKLNYAETQILEQIRSKRA